MVREPRCAVAVGREQIRRLGGTAAHDAAGDVHRRAARRPRAALATGRLRQLVVRRNREQIAGDGRRIFRPVRLDAERHGQRPGGHVVELVALSGSSFAPRRCLRRNFSIWTRANAVSSGGAASRNAFAIFPCGCARSTTYAPASNRRLPTALSAYACALRGSKRRRRAPDLDPRSEQRRHQLGGARRIVRRAANTTRFIASVRPSSTARCRNAR